MYYPLLDALTHKAIFTISRFLFPILKNDISRLYLCCKNFTPGSSLHNHASLKEFFSNIEKYN